MTPLRGGFLSSIQLTQPPGDILATAQSQIPKFSVLVDTHMLAALRQHLPLKRERKRLPSGILLEIPRSMVGQGRWRPQASR